MKNINQYVFDDKERKTKCQYMAPHFCICIVVAWPHNTPLDETNCIFLVLRHFQPSVGPKHWAIHPSTTPENNDRLRLMPVCFFIVWLLKVAQRYITFCTFITNHLIWSGRACGRVMIYLRCWSWSWSNISYQNITDLFVYVCFRCVFVTLRKNKFANFLV